MDSDNQYRFFLRWNLLYIVGVSMNNEKKMDIAYLVMTLGCFLYPTIELSRLIILFWDEYGLLEPFYLELALIHVGFLIGALLAWKAIRRGK